MKTNSLNAIITSSIQNPHKDDEYLYNNHIETLEQIKNQKKQMIDISKPIQYPKTKYHKEEKQKQIDKENNLMFMKMLKINMELEKNKKEQDQFYYPSHQGRTQIEQQKVSKENQAMKKRIQNIKPTINLPEIQKDYDKKVIYKEICQKIKGSNSPSPKRRMIPDINDKSNMNNNSSAGSLKQKHIYRGRDRMITEPGKSYVKDKSVEKLQQFDNQKNVKRVIVPIKSQKIIRKNNEFEKNKAVSDKIVDLIEQKEMDRKKIKETEEEYTEDFEQ